MEHRYSQRRPARAAVRIRCRDGETIPARIINVSGEGAFLETAGMEFRQIAHLEVEIPTWRDAAWHRVCWPALVIHRSHRGVGVCFIASEDEIGAVLSNLAHHHGSIASRPIALSVSCASDQSLHPDKTNRKPLSRASVMTRKGI
ncbi:MAG: PilZ domain-containing protein [Thiotrichales bacterium]